MQVRRPHPSWLLVKANLSTWHHSKMDSLQGKTQQLKLSRTMEITHWCSSKMPIFKVTRSQITIKVLSVITTSSPDWSPRKMNNPLQLVKELSSKTKKRHLAVDRSQPLKNRNRKLPSRVKAKLSSSSRKTWQQLRTLAVKITTMKTIMRMTKITILMMIRISTLVVRSRTIVLQWMMV